MVLLEEKFIVIAHRGASALEPENTIAAFRKAVDMGADAFELDVRRTSDGKLIVLHDDNLKRVANIDKKVSELAYDDIRNIKVFGKEPIPTLEEVLEIFANRIPIFIELKDEGIEEEVVRLIEAYKAIDNVLIISFNYESLKRVKQINSSIDIGLLTYRYPIPIDEAVKMKAYAILPRYNIVTPNIVREIHAKKLKIFTWTVNDVALALKMISYGVNGIATDNPGIRSSIQKQTTLTKYGHS
ncbi:glycerophosphoryl diester phosphodiesterase [Ignisphaera aggregans DSM 17230]|uniref:Glycerophosphoryl diester phosphodiesterase n=1 Tax=Ignisphaera aggregans (strain DSM 17230 / JCM 13409 / AQ1.S1) TaxID=583356 RepID=E0SNY8_IGNAA|nr:glycerophosphoryl diester phosphodiesterase [Ignisphaera aggregans DSM 17230]